MEADQRVAEYKKKHDEMFDSVSGLNKRIDELEEHKIHLLEKLKSLNLLLGPSIRPPVEISEESGDGKRVHGCQLTDRR